MIFEKLRSLLGIVVKAPAAALLPLLWVAALPLAAVAADYPAKPLRLIVPFAPGGGNDLLARLVSTQLATGLGQQVVVDNRPGASGITATDIVARSAPDGYTMLLGFIGPLALSPALTRLPYDPAADFTPLDFLAKSYHILVVNPALQVRSVQELIALARREPGKLNYASSGQGANLHLVTELFKNATGIDMVHVPYKGAGPATTAVLAGEAQVLFGSIASSLSYVRANRLVALAVTSPQRSALAPELPTLGESGIADVEVPSWYTLLLPARTPLDVAERLRAELRRVAGNREFVEQLARQAIDVQTLAPGEYARFLKAEIDKWATVVRTNGIRID
jgi:tripartite-type tricarboxylate transporter receptor subunit TctC